MKIIKLLTLYLLIIVVCTIHAEEKDIEQILRKDANKIINSEKGLSQFSQAIKELKHGKRDHVVIVHLGDSHIQAGFFTDNIKTALQNMLGNAGRGLITPYQVARTNEPGGYVSSSPDLWTVSKIHDREPEALVGITGLTLSCDNPQAQLAFELTDDSKIKKLTLFHQKDQNYFSIDILNEQGLVIDTISGNKNYFYSETVLKKPLQKINIRARKTSQEQKQIALHGISVENGKKGLLYHAIGINGVSFKEYARQDHFYEQLAALNPDLIIISLGTNYAYNNPELSCITLKELIHTITTKINNNILTSDILFTTPPDHYKIEEIERKEVCMKQNGVVETRNIVDYNLQCNESVGDAQKSIIEYALQHNHAYWDFHTIMGGKESMKIWVLNNLARRDYVHFRKRGYEKYSTLFIEALKKVLNDRSAENK